MCPHTRDRFLLFFLLLFCFPSSPFLISSVGSIVHSFLALFTCALSIPFWLSSLHPSLSTVSKPSALSILELSLTPSVISLTLFYSFLLALSLPSLLLPFSSSFPYLSHFHFFSISFSFISFFLSFSLFFSISFSHFSLFSFSRFSPFLPSFLLLIFTLFSSNSFSLCFLSPFFSFFLSPFFPLSHFFSLLFFFLLFPLFFPYFFPHFPLLFPFCFLFFSLPSPSTPFPSSPISHFHHSLSPTLYPPAQGPVHPHCGRDRGRSSARSGVSPPSPRPHPAHLILGAGQRGEHSLSRPPHCT